MSDRALPEGVEGLLQQALDFCAGSAAEYGAGTPEHSAYTNVHTFIMRLAKNAPKIEAHLATRLLSDEAVEALAKARYEREEIPHAGPWDEAPPNSRLLAEFREDAKQDLAAISTVIGREAGDG